MKPRLIGIAMAIALLFIAYIAEAQYAAAAARTTRRRTAVVVLTATNAKDEQAAQEQAAQAEPAQGDHLPYSTVVTKLPEGCDKVVVNDVQYYHCGNDYYRAAYQENNLVYITTEPPV